TTASGDYSTALGNVTQAQGANSTALGYKTKAIGIKSAAFGDSTIASGDNATALGYHTLASDDYSTAMGGYTTASGASSTAIGNSTIASGPSSTAMGYGTTASGDISIAMGYVTTASGSASTAMGAFTTASGNSSTAMGYNASTNGQAYSFAIGGNGTATNCTSPNQFMTRFDNYTFWISASNYAYLLPSSNGWAYTSDRNKKERFEELDGETVLKKISGITFSSWNFKATDTRQYRHYGVAAQDFYNAFGKDSYGNIGNDTTVSPLDLLGVAYSAIKALEKRSIGLLQDNKQLKEENALLQKNMDEIKDGLALANSELNKKLALLEAMVNELAALKEKKVVVPNTVAMGNQP
ncbi:MAG: tail fiber domain-containing protein, partial [Ferruginibacter sp.]